MSSKSDLNNNNKVLSAEELIRLIEIAYELRKALMTGDIEKVKSLQHNRMLLITLLEYLVHNLNDPNIDTELMKFLAKFLGIDLKPKKDKTDNKLKEEELTKQEKERRYRLIVLEIYKMVTPRQIAGKTSLQNFITNVMTRGIDEALKYEGKEYVNEISLKELNKLEFSNNYHILKKGEGIGF